MGKQVQKLRGTVTTARVETEESPEADAMRNLAYVVSSANDNIQALQRTVKLQEKELSEKTDQCAAVQRNYETLARIRQADQSEFLQLKTRQSDEHSQLLRAQADLRAAREQSSGLERKIAAGEAAQAQIVTLNGQLQAVTATRDELESNLTMERGKNATLAETNRGLNANIDKLSRAQNEMLQRARKVRAQCVHCTDALLPTPLSHSHPPPPPTPNRLMRRCGS